MLAMVGLIGVVLGTAAACVAQRFPGHVELVQTGAGLLLIGGIALSSFALPVVL
jgi:hypothetical protein